MQSGLIRVLAFVYKIFVFINHVCMFNHSFCLYVLLAKSIVNKFICIVLYIVVAEPRH